MSTMDLHYQDQLWAAALIGKPYKEDGEGPDAFNCWGLVRWVFNNVYGIPMPYINVGASETKSSREAAIRAVERETGWRSCVDTRPQDRDILLMYGPYGRHVALALKANDGLHVLHAIEDVGVTLTPFSEMWFMCFRDITIWRKA